MQITGIIFGLLAAFFQSISYICSRVFVGSREGGVLRLLVASHVTMGVVSVAALPLVWHPAMPPFGTYVWVLLGVSVFYIAGQAALFLLVRKTEASRVAPLLGFKIVVLALITVLVLGRTLAAVQWGAVLLAVTAVLTLSFSGGRLGLRSLAWLLFACVGYSLSDLCIERLVLALQPIPRLRAAGIAVSLSYTLCGGVAVLLLLPLIRVGIRPVDWRHAVPFALSWLLGMACLFTCFGAIGALYGNVLQATRGLMSVLIGAVLAHLGHAHIEQRVPHRVVLRRAVAAALMVAAIWLFGQGYRT